MLEVAEYTHDGHPDVASQYSQGRFRTGQKIADAESWRRGAITELENEGRRALLEHAGDERWSFEVEDDSDDELYEVSLRVSFTCGLDDHDDEGCECYEYVRSLSLVAA